MVTQPNNTDPSPAEALPSLDSSPVALVGGSGRLGTALSERLVGSGHRIKIIDRYPPDARLPAERAEFIKLDVLERDRLADILQGVRCVVHLAGLHGLHLAQGVPRKAIWQANVGGSSAILWASNIAGVRRFILASSTSVFGPGSSANQSARLIDEASPVIPTDVYDVGKLIAERATINFIRKGVFEGTCLRFGRFFFGSPSDYHLRKLSTGLDLTDATGVISKLIDAPVLSHEIYCVVSDLDLSDDQRRRLGVDLAGVIEEVLPGFRRLIEERRGWKLPPRVGKSVSSALLRRDIGYIPSRNLSWLNDCLLSESPASTRRESGQASFDPLFSGAALGPSSNG